MSLRRSLKSSGKRVLRLLFEAGQYLGVDVLPRHFYSEIPDLRRLRAGTDWKRPMSMAGVAGTGIEEQLAFVARCCTAEAVARLAQGSVIGEARAANDEAGFGPIEADFLYAYVFSCRPPQILQIGCGVSTAICLRAAADAGYRPEVICVEPYPSAFLLDADARGQIRLLRVPAQQLDLAVIDGLADGAFFFVDSTHTLGPAGEVSRIVLEMLPRLRTGMRVHFHDIYFPYDYGRQLLRGGLFFWHESVLVHAFLAYNSRFAIEASLSMLHYAAPARLKQHLPAYEPAANDHGLEAGPGHFPSSLYLRVVR